MGHSIQHFQGRSTILNDLDLLGLILLARERLRNRPRSNALADLAAKWTTELEQYGPSVIDLHLDETIKTEDAVDDLIRLFREVESELSSYPDHVPAPTLNALAAGRDLRFGDFPVALLKAAIERVVQFVSGLPPLTAELARIERLYPLPGSYEKCVAFFFEAIRTLAPALPSAAEDALATAKSYWVKGDRSAPLLTAKAQVWREVDRVKGGIDATAEATLRCVLCVLDPAPPTQDVHELLAWFVEFATAAGFPESEVIRLLHASFP